MAGKKNAAKSRAKAKTGARASKRKSPSYRRVRGAKNPHTHRHGTMVHSHAHEGPHQH